MKLLLTVAAGILGVSALGAQGTTCELRALQDAAGKYVRAYQRAFSAVVAREQYSQRAFMSGRLETRNLESEVALVALDDLNWILFRDVVKVDGRAVQERADRLTSLFLKPSSDLGAQARRILDEGARYNIGPITRTLNTPTQLLDFVRFENQPRSEFRLGGRATVEGVQTCELRFEETATPRMIVTHDAAPVHGRVWLRPEDGAILRTELQLLSAGTLATIRVTYRKQAAPNMWLPYQMTESYELQRPSSSSASEAESTSTTRVDGTALYSGFKQFAVDTRTIIR